MLCLDRSVGRVRRYLQKTVSDVTENVMRSWMWRLGSQGPGVRQKLPTPHTLRARAKSLQSRLSPCGPMDCSPLDSSVHGLLQARILEWVSRFLLQGIFPTQGSNPHPFRLLRWQVGSLPLAPPGDTWVPLKCSILKVFINKYFLSLRRNLRGHS